MLKPIRYPFDKSGRSPNNFIQDEPHELTPGRERRIIVPRYIPFYTQSVIITDKATGVTLTTDDYYAGVFKETIQREVGKEVSSIIVITNKNVSDQVAVSYQTVGGQYALASADDIRQLLLNLSKDSRPVVFDTIIGKPSRYPPTPHMHDIGDVYGFEYIVYAIDRLRQAILIGDIDKFLELYQYIDQKDDELLKLIMANKANIAINAKNINVVQDNLDDLRLKIYGTKDKSATKVIGSFMPPSKRPGNLVSWDEENHGYYVGHANTSGGTDIYVDNVEGTDIPLDVDKTHGYTPEKAFKTLTFAIDQHRETNGQLTFYLRGKQEHRLPYNLDWSLKAQQAVGFSTYQTDKGITLKGQALSRIYSLDGLQSFMKDGAATLYLASTIDPQDKDGYGFAKMGKPLFNQYSNLYQSHLRFDDLKVVVREWNGNDILKRIEASNQLDDTIKDKAKLRYTKANSSIFGNCRTTFRNTRLITSVQNRDNDVFHSLFSGEQFISFYNVNYISGKIWDLEFSPEAKSGLYIEDQELLFVDDGTQCTEPTPSSQSFVYLIDHLDFGDSHNHWTNILTEARPDYSGQDVLFLSEGYMTGQVICDPYKLNPKGDTSGKGGNNTNTDSSIGIPFRDRTGSIWIRRRNDDNTGDIFVKVYPAIWQGDAELPVVNKIQGLSKVNLAYQVVEKDVVSTYNDIDKKSLRESFFAYDDRESYIDQIWPAVWQDLEGFLPKAPFNKNKPFIKAYVTYNKANKKYYVETIDKKVKRVLYPAQFEPGRTLNNTYSYARTAQHAQDYYNNPNNGGANKETIEYDPSRTTSEYRLNAIETKWEMNGVVPAYYHIAKINKDGVLFSESRSEYMQYKDPVNQDIFGGGGYPRPTIGNDGNVTWDYGTFVHYKQINQVPSYTPIGYKHPQRRGSEGYFSNGIVIGSNNTFFIDPYILVSKEDLLPDYIVKRTNTIPTNITESNPYKLFVNKEGNIVSFVSIDPGNTTDRQYHVPVLCFKPGTPAATLGVNNAYEERTNNGATRVDHDKFIAQVTLNAQYNDLGKPDSVVYKDKYENNYEPNRSQIDYYKRFFTPISEYHSTMTDNFNRYMFDYQYRYYYAVLPLSGTTEYFAFDETKIDPKGYLVLEYRLVPMFNEANKTILTVMSYVTDIVKVMPADIPATANIYYTIPVTPGQGRVLPGARGLLNRIIRGMSNRNSTYSSLNVLCSPFYRN